MNTSSTQKDAPLILVVDDDQFMRIQLRRAMEQAGYRVAEADDGEQALAVYARLHPDVVLLDAMMPVMDGFTCCHLLHQLSLDNDSRLTEKAIAPETLAAKWHRENLTPLEMLPYSQELTAHNSLHTHPVQQHPEATSYADGSSKDAAFGKVLLRDTKHTTYPPVLMITALEDQDSVNRAFAAGAVDYITKPIHWTVLRQRVKRVLQEHQAMAELCQQTERSLLSEERLRLALTAAHMGIWDWDLLTGKIDYSPTTEANFGMAPRTFDGTYESFLKSIYPEDYQRVTQSLQNALDNNADYDLEFRVLWADKSVHWVASKGQVYYDQTGKAIRMTGINMNITERKRNEEILRQSEERFRTLIDTAQEGIWVLDAYANTTYVNQRLSEMLGYTIEEMLGRSLFNFMDNLAQVNAAKNFAQRQRGINEEYDYKFLRKDGSEIWTIISTNPIVDKNGKFIGVLGMLTDITERKHSEEKIREQAALLNITTDAILVRGQNNQILFWNQGAERLYGWKAEEALGKNANELLYHQSSHQVTKILETLTNVGEWQGELHQVTKTGRKIIVESRWTLVRDDATKPNSILTVNTDITERKKLENQFLRTQRLESLGTLAGGIAHDLNNVLAPIMMAVQLLQVKSIDDHSQRLMSIIETNVKRGADLVKQVLSFARGIEGERAEIQIGHLVLELKKILSETFPKSINIQADIQINDLWVLYGDATQLYQVLMNLCVNARDAMPESGTLSISAKNIVLDEHLLPIHPDAKVGSYIMIQVADTGTGITPEVLENIFEPFFTTKEVGKGTGLGLSTAIGIIKSHGGFMNVYSEINKGTEFQIYLPATKTTTTQNQQDHPWKLLKGHGELILVVDDEAAICEVAKVSLESFGYRVLAAKDGIEAIALYTQHLNEIKVVILDMMMPSMDGTTTIQILQKINPQVNIVVASGLMSNEKATKISAFGIKTLLQKPYTTEQVLKVIHQVLS